MSNFITEIKIGKVRHLENIDIKLGNEKKHLILTGKNGCGKTAVLEKLDSVLSVNYTQGYPIIEANGLGVKFYINDLSFSYAKDYIYTFFSTERGIKFHKPKTIKKINFTKIEEYKVKKLNQDFLQYIVNLKIEYLFAQLDNDEEESLKLDAWFNKFEIMLKNIFNDNSFKLIFDRKNYNFWIERDNRERFDLNSLSAGYSAIIDIITELILKIETTESKSFDCEGIVLIDEVENHLHVELQKNILPLLTNFFPNIQFIVTTHSPFVLQSIENSVVYDLERKESLSGEKLNKATYSDIVKNYFEVDSEFSEVLESDIKKYQNLVKKFENKNLTIEGEKELLDLDIKLDKIAPMLSDDIYLRFKESQDRIQENG
ncbi:MAG: Putative ATP binding protein SugR [uncultured Sulfurovum sp.]|uniref:ATP binding protein SugR n=1 Tax=uncultured Sulfurovum sp. TaxID=269237 RepID=A0A6S6T559_9BACT|nr:MAG: Putative ATP binding protein SugR [uncultured Sulfurovum sp.]